MFQKVKVKSLFPQNSNKIDRPVMKSTNSENIEKREMNTLAPNNINFTWKNTSWMETIIKYFTLPKEKEEIKIQTAFFIIIKWVFIKDPFFK